MAPASFGEGPRGLMATRDIAEGEVLMSLPASLLISYKTARESDLVGMGLFEAPPGWRIDRTQEDK